MFGRWFGRTRPGAGGSTAKPSAKSAGEIADDIRATIVRLDAERTAAARLAGLALVNQAEVRRACGEQLELLGRAAREAHRGEGLAADAAATADVTDLETFERTAAGLRTVQDALDLAAEPVRALLVTARDNAENAQAVLGRARDVFDEQVRAQVRLLVALERAERARIARDCRS